jgi:alkylation response protein AidB-like acyl-CoA dehydrogenase
MPMTAFMGLTAAIAALGTARNAINWWRDRMKVKPIFGATTTTAEKPAAQMRLARAENDVRMVELILRDAARKIDMLSLREEPATIPERLELRIQIANAVDMARTAVRIMAEAAGTSAHYSSSPMQRALRDLNVITTHIVFDMDTVTEQRGRVLVGLEPTTTLL